MAEHMEIDVEQVVGSAEEALMLLIPFWLRGRAWLTGRMSPEEAREDARMLAGAVPYRVREWTDYDIPQEAAETLLQAEAQAMARMATMVASDTNGGHDAVA
jgi:hypothetical protein